MRRWWSGQSQQTVNLSAKAFVGSNPTRRTKVSEKAPELILVLFLNIARKLLSVRTLLQVADIFYDL